MSFVRALGSLALAAGAFATALGATLALRYRVWEVLAPTVSEAQTMEADAAVLESLLERAQAPSGSGPDVVLVVLDTVGARYLDLYGYPFPTMPSLTRRAQGGRVYTRATAESPWTLPSHASLFTGLYVAEHGADGRLLTAAERARREESGRLVDNGRPVRLERPLADDAVTLAETLSGAGWLTVGIAANQAYLQPFWNLDQGFDAWVCQQIPRGDAALPYARGDRVTSLALQALDTDLRSGPFGESNPLFLFLNYMEAHVPYTPRTGFVRDPDALSLRYRRGRSRERLLDRVLAREKPLPPSIRESWIQAYEAELRFLDTQVERLFAGLEERRFFDRGYLVIVGDHGEYFGEHALVEHSKDVYQSVLWVPLVVWGPGIQPGRDDSLVQLGHVHDWILQWTRTGFPRTRGEVAVSEIYGSRFRDVFSPTYGDRFNRVRQAFRVGDRKIILGSDGSFEAYSLSADPEEERDLSSMDWARELKDRGLRWGTQHKPVVTPGKRSNARLAREVEERMRELGYVE